MCKEMPKLFSKIVTTNPVQVFFKMLILKDVSNFFMQKEIVTCPFILGTNCKVFLGLNFFQFSHLRGESRSSNF